MQHLSISQSKTFLTSVGRFWLVIGIVLAAFSGKAEASLANEKSWQGVNFHDWLVSFKASDHLKDFAPELIDDLFKNAKPQQKVIDASARQWEFTLTIPEYIARVVSKTRIVKGRLLYKKHEQLLKAIEKSTGVDRYVLTAIWGIESSFGAATRNSSRLLSVVDSLSTLAWHNKSRLRFATNQLKAVAKMAKAGIGRDKIRGSWAGAMGQVQFIPSSYIAYSKGFEHDGAADIWDSVADSLASAGNYLEKNRWVAGKPWGVLVKRPAKVTDVDGETKSLAEWRELGLTKPDGSAIDLDGDYKAELLAGPGFDGYGILRLHNFRSILTYNRSNAYASAVGLLSDSIARRGSVPLKWRK